MTISIHAIQTEAQRVNLNLELSTIACFGKTTLEELDHDERTRLYNSLLRLVPLEKGQHRHAGYPSFEDIPVGCIKHNLDGLPYRGFFFTLGDQYVLLSADTMGASSRYHKWTEHQQQFIKPAVKNLKEAGHSLDELKAIAKTRTQENEDAKTQPSEERENTPTQVSGHYELSRRGLEKLLNDFETLLQQQGDEAQTEILRLAARFIDFLSVPNTILYFRRESGKLIACYQRAGRYAETAPIKISDNKAFLTALRDSCLELEPQLQNPPAQDEAKEEAESEPLQKSFVSFTTGTAPVMLEWPSEQNASHIPYDRDFLNKLLQRSCQNDVDPNLLNGIIQGFGEHSPHWKLIEQNTAQNLLENLIRQKDLPEGLFEIVWKQAGQRLLTVENKHHLKRLIETAQKTALLALIGELPPLRTAPLQAVPRKENAAAAGTANRAPGRHRKRRAGISQAKSYESFSTLGDDLISILRDCVQLIESGRQIGANSRIKAQFKDSLVSPLKECLNNPSNPRPADEKEAAKRWLSNVSLRAAPNVLIKAHNSATLHSVLYVMGESTTLRLLERFVQHQQFDPTPILGWTLFHAATRGDMGTVNRLLRIGVKPHELKREGTDPIFSMLPDTSIRSEFICQFISALAKYGLELDKVHSLPGGFEDTLITFILRMKANDLSIAQNLLAALLNKGADPNKAVRHSNAPEMRYRAADILLTLKDQNVPHAQNCLELIKRYGGKILLGRAPVQYFFDPAQGIHYPNLEILREINNPTILFRLMADRYVTASTPLDREGTSLFIVLCMSVENIESFEFFIESMGYQINSPTLEDITHHSQGTLPKGTTPLHAAALRGRTKTCEFLIQHGANPTLKDGNGKTPINVAEANNRPETAKAIKAAYRQILRERIQARDSQAALSRETAGRREEGIPSAAAAAAGAPESDQAAGLRPAKPAV